MWMLGPLCSEVSLGVWHQALRSVFLKLPMCNSRSHVCSNLYAVICAPPAAVEWLTVPLLLHCTAGAGGGCPPSSWVCLLTRSSIHCVEWLVPLASLDTCPGVPMHARGVSFLGKFLTVERV